MTRECIFLTKFRTPLGLRLARLLIESIQTFGGEMSACPVWVFPADPANESGKSLASPQVEVIPLHTPDAISGYPFGDKVYACARAEEMAPAGTRSLIYIDLECLVVQPPVLFDLGTEFDAALRPVHIRNVGSPADEVPDAYWRGIYNSLGIKDLPFTVESFVDGQRLRAYFNTHGLAANPARGLFRQWDEHFERLVRDDAFQAATCGDERHRIFLFQAVFSALVAIRLPAERVRILPHSYNYPYNLQGRVPAERRAKTLNELVCFTFEERSIHPDDVTDIDIEEPLRTWLEARVPAI